MRNSQKVKQTTTKFAYRAATAVFAIAGLQAMSSAATYFVSPTGNDANAGTIAKPFASLYRATYRTVPGDVVYLRGGTYNYTVPQTIQGTGSAAASLTVMSYPGENAVLDFTKSTAKQNGVQVAGNYVKISNLTVQNAPSVNLSVWNANNVSVRNVRSYGAYSAGFLVGSPAASSTVNGKVVMGGNHDVEISGCEVWNCVKVNQKLNASQWQPAIQTFQSNKVTITKNSVHQNWGEGIGVCTTSESQISGNTVWDNFSVNLYMDNVDQMTVKSNFVYNTLDSRFYRGGRAATGICMAVEGVPNPIGLRNSEISNNTIYNCFSGIWYSAFGLGGGMKNFSIRNNTIYKTVGGPLLWIDNDKGHVGNVISNNIFQQSGSAAMTNIATMTGLSMGNNCWFGGNVGTGKQSTDLLANPLMVRPGSYNLNDYSLNNNSPCLNRGIGVLVGEVAHV